MAKLDFFRQIKKRLKPGGLFAFVEGCADKSAPDWNDKIDLYAATHGETAQPRICCAAR